MPEIVGLAEKHVIFKVTPKEIDEVVESKKKLHKLNWLEAQTMAQIVTALTPDLAYVDAADIVETRFGQQIVEFSTHKCRVVSEHKADLTYPIVSAASILAKVERDNTIAVLRSELGDFGSGYLADQKTTTFLKTWLRTHEDYPACVRQSWKPAKAIKAENGTEQKTLF